MDFLTLDKKATFAALALGALLLFFGKELALLFFLSMLYFLVLSAIVSNIGIRAKKKEGLFGTARGVKNVIANGTWPLIIAIAYFIFGTHANAPLFAVVFLSAVASITADKFSSEIGVLGSIPVSIIGFKKVKKGTSGGITALGLFSGFIGAFLISLMLLPFYYGYSSYLLAHMVAIIVASGFVGTIADSFFGYFEEKGIGTKHTTNLLCAISGSLFSVLVIFV